MKRHFFSALAAAGALATAGITLGATPPVHVAIDNYAFKAPTITVGVGSTVIWKNGDDDPHTVTADDNSFDSSGLDNGATYSRTFTKPGRYAYHCKLHPFMKGVVIVAGSNS